MKSKTTGMLTALLMAVTAASSVSYASVGTEADALTAVRNLVAPFAGATGTDALVISAMNNGTAPVVLDNAEITSVSVKNPLYGNVDDTEAPTSISLYALLPAGGWATFTGGNPVTLSTATGYVLASPTAQFQYILTQETVNGAASTVNRLRFIFTPSSTATALNAETLGSFFEDIKTTSYPPAGATVTSGTKLTGWTVQGRAEIVASDLPLGSTALTLYPFEATPEIKVKTANGTSLTLAPSDSLEFGELWNIAEGTAPLAEIEFISSGYTTLSLSLTLDPGLITTRTVRPDVAFVNLFDTGLPSKRLRYVSETVFGVMPQLEDAIDDVAELIDGAEASATSTVADRIDAIETVLGGSGTVRARIASVALAGVASDEYTEAMAGISVIDNADPYVGVTLLSDADVDFAANPFSASGATLTFTGSVGGVAKLFTADLSSMDSFVSSGTTSGATRRAFTLTASDGDAILVSHLGSDGIFTAPGTAISTAGDSLTNLVAKLNVTAEPFASAGTLTAKTLASIVSRA